MQEKKIKHEFGFDSEAQAVKEYSLLHRDFMYTNYPLIADEIISKLQINDAYVLDIGTGLGTLAIELARRLPESKVIGIDISDEMLAEARKNSQESKVNNTEFKICDAQNMEFKDNSFDLVVSFGVLHHLNDLKLMFGEIKRILKSMGTAYIYDLKKDSPQDVVDEIASNMNADYKKAFLESVKEAVDIASLEKILKNLSIAEFSISEPRYSRRTIIKNRDILRNSNMMGERFNRILMEIYFKK